MKVHSIRAINKDNDEYDAPILIEEQNITSAVAQVDFTDFRDDGRFNTYLFMLDGVTAETDNVSFFMRTSSDNGTSFDSGASDYGFNGEHHVTTTTGGGFASNGQSEIELNRPGLNLGTAFAEKWSGFIRWHVGFGDGVPFCFFRATMRDDAARTTSLWGSGTRLSDGGQVNGVRFIVSSGNINGGRFQLFGLK